MYNADLTFVNMIFYEVEPYTDMPRPLDTGEAAIDNQLDGTFVVLM